MSKDKVDVEEVLDTMREVAPEGVVLEAAEDGQVEALGPYVQRVLDVVGFPTAWVSDLSCVGDFPVDEDDCQEFARTLGVPVALDDYLVEVARRLQDKDPEQ